jgi:hypothetical protein
VVKLKVLRLINLAKRKCRAGNFVFAASAARHTFYERGFAAAQIANQLNNLVAA